MKKKWRKKSNTEKNKKNNKERREKEGEKRREMKEGIRGTRENGCWEK